MKGIQDSFLETFGTLISEDKYTHFIGKQGPVVELPEEIQAVGVRNAIPYINSNCRLNFCVYDISTLHEIYAQEFDVTDEFRLQEGFPCFYCDNHIKYKDFFTCESMIQDLEKHFGRKGRRGLSSSMSKQGLRSRGSQGNSSLDQSLSLVKRLSKRDSNYDQLKSGIRLEKVDESVEQDSWAPAPFQPEPDDAPVENSEDGPWSPIPKATALQYRNSAAFIDGSAVSKFIPRRKSSAKLSSLLDWKEYKHRLAEIELPDLAKFDLVEAQQMKQTLSSGRELTWSVDQKVSNWLNNVPTSKDLNHYVSSSKLSPRLYELLTFYLKCRLCKSETKLGFFWHFEKDQSNHFVPEKSLVDKNMILHNQDYELLVIVVTSQTGSTTYLQDKKRFELSHVEYKSPEKIPASNDSAPPFSKDLLDKVEGTNPSAFADLKALYSEYFVQAVPDCTLSTIKQTTAYTGLLASLEFVFNLAGLENSLKQTPCEDRSEEHT